MDPNRRGCFRFDEQVMLQNLDLCLKVQSNVLITSAVREPGGAILFYGICDGWEVSDHYPEYIIVVTNHEDGTKTWAWTPCG